MAAGRNGLIAALDIGTTKVCCFIARVENGMPRVVGIGLQASRGMRSGAVVDMEATEGTIRAAVDIAEKMCGETIREVFVSLAAGQPQSHLSRIEIPVSGHEIGQADIDRVLAEGRRHHHPAERDVIHSIPTGYAIDGSTGIRDPRGMWCERLGVNMHVVTAASGPVRNLATCVGRAHLGLAGLVISPFAAGLACLVEDEMELGVTLIEMGGGTTSISVFYDGQLVHTDSLPLGGSHITADIARGLSTPMAHAERLKTFYGSGIGSHADDNETIEVPQVGEGEDAQALHVPRSHLVGIIKPRVEETLELVRDRVGATGFDKIAGRRVVLTGGASQLQGMREQAARILDKQVRLGRPIRVAGLAETTGGPAFSTCAGLLSYALQDRVEVESAVPEPETTGAGPFTRVFRWLTASG